jgi:colanic acid/amylovoran biosynthesis glycosyltransferase
VKLVYVTSSLPHGPLEAFVLPEIEALERLGHEVWLVPMYPRGELLHADARPHLARTVSEPLFSGAIAAAAVRELPVSPRHALSLLGRTAATRPRLAAKNLAVYPKALWLAGQIRDLGAEHVHAHWAATSATLAMTAAELAGVPWSLTAHRWDIREGNLLRKKARSACFVRAISEAGAGELRERVGLEGWSPWLLRMGVDVPATQAPVHDGAPLRILTAANLLPVKGHRYLFEALSGLEETVLDVAGAGPLRAELEEQARDLPVTFLGAVSHPELLQGLREGRWDAVVLPSVPTDEGDQEGVPVSLIEAMAAGVPVVSTASGAIPELVTEGTGILVPPRDPAALAVALERLRDPALRQELAAAGRAWVEAEFDVERIAAELAARFAAC